jgi:hypothetical protein
VVVGFNERRSNGDFSGLSQEANVAAMMSTNTASNTMIEFVNTDLLIEVRLPTKLA